MFDFPGMALTNATMRVLTLSTTSVFQG